MLLCASFGYCMKEKICYKCIKNCKVTSTIYIYMTPKSDGHAKVRRSAHKSDGLLEIGTTKPDGYAKVRRSVSYSQVMPKSDGRTKSDVPPFVYAPRYSDVARKKITSMMSRHENVIGNVDNNNLNQGILRWMQQAFEMRDIILRK